MKNESIKFIQLIHEICNQDKIPLHSLTIVQLAKESYMLPVTDSAVIRLMIKRLPDHLYKFLNELLYVAIQEFDKTVEELQAEKDSWKKQIKQYSQELRGKTIQLQNNVKKDGKAYLTYQAYYEFFDKLCNDPNELFNGMIHSPILRFNSNYSTLIGKYTTEDKENLNGLHQACKSYVDITTDITKRKEVDAWFNENDELINMTVEEFYQYMIDIAFNKGEEK